MWKQILSAPSGCDLELAVFDEEGGHSLVFPCRKADKGWQNAATGALVDIRPTHWRDWQAERTPASHDKSVGGPA
ncbi:hypothetical protein FJ941_23700 [Mesorhizobium sp. B2-3-13]|nr:MULTISPECIES: hypothetical protein [unclassified Mesorhizobium]TPJ38881.1 hypothetical protein FJ432_20740 [Mesorhizobium sp. B2-6-5]TPJ79547.1 hypothetical protein FJ434_23335 [Mesorhizobium sp. B2-5-13]TPK46369.1 hypothetical protein FJ560_19800 [Mesorhizobium sp. B2-5-5]TPL78531.1 hypothetical protein FJ941_23700 [Mesorhizobium sp. B2-3-13]TPL94528.1 hypothetical protein FJ960_28015 [Mesorhizobium sp. B2-3-11]